MRICSVSGGLRSQEAPSDVTGQAFYPRPDGSVPAASGREALSAVASGSNSQGSLLYVEFAARYINVYNFVQLFL